LPLLWLICRIFGCHAKWHGGYCCFLLVLHQSCTAGEAVKILIGSNRAVETLWPAGLCWPGSMQVKKMKNLEVQAGGLKVKHIQKIARYGS
jgi:hypothetical protein